jgi:hypothetical protein
MAVVIDLPSIWHELVCIKVELTEKGPTADVLGRLGAIPNVTLAMADQTGILGIINMIQSWPDSEDALILHAAQTTSWSGSDMKRSITISYVKRMINDDNVKEGAHFNPYQFRLGVNPEETVKQVIQLLALLTKPEYGNLVMEIPRSQRYPHFKDEPDANPVYKRNPNNAPAMKAKADALVESWRYTTAAQIDKYEQMLTAWMAADAMSYEHTMHELLANVRQRRENQSVAQLPIIERLLVYSTKHNFPLTDDMNSMVVSTVDNEYTDDTMPVVIAHVAHANAMALMLQWTRPGLTDPANLFAESIEALITGISFEELAGRSVPELKKKGLFELCKHVGSRGAALAQYCTWPGYNELPKRRMKWYMEFLSKSFRHTFDINGRYFARGILNPLLTTAMYYCCQHAVEALAEHRPAFKKPPFPIDREAIGEPPPGPSLNALYGPGWVWKYIKQNTLDDVARVDVTVDFHTMTAFKPDFSRFVHQALTLVMMDTVHWPSIIDTLDAYDPKMVKNAVYKAFGIDKPHSMPSYADEQRDRDAYADAWDGGTGHIGRYHGGYHGGGGPAN